MKLTCLSLLLAISQCTIAQEHVLYREIDQIIRYDTEIAYPIEKSFIVGIIKGDSSWIFNFGPEHIDTLDKFEIGGVTKVFTASLASKLHEEGLINLDSTINSYLPIKYRNVHLSNHTLTDLLLHQINFPKRPSNLATKEYNLSDPYAYYTKEDLLDYYAEFVPKKKQALSAQKLNYSHINYGLLELIIESAMKMPLEDLFQFYLFQDWGLYNTSLNFNASDIKVGFDRSNMIPEPWTFQSFAGSEGLSSCMLDLMRFTAVSIAGDPTYIKTSQTIREEAKIHNKLTMSYAWYILKSRKTGPIYTHSGMTERHKTYIHFKKESQTGVVILCQASTGVGELGMLILRLINNNWKK